MNKMKYSPDSLHYSFWINCGFCYREGPSQTLSDCYVFLAYNKKEGKVKST